MFLFYRLCKCFVLFLALATTSSAKSSSENSSFEQLLNYQESALMDAFHRNKIVINRFKSPNIFTGYIPFKENRKFKVEVRLTDRMIVCVERVPGVDRQICANETVLNIAKSDTSSAKRYLIYRVSYFKHDGNKEPEPLYFSYRYAEDEEGLFSSWDKNEPALKKIQKKLKLVATQFVKDAENLGNKVQSEHPVIPDSVPRIELLARKKIMDDGQIYEAKVSIEGKPTIKTLVKAKGVLDDTKVFAFIEKSKTPSLYGHVFEYSRLFLGKTFDGGKKVYELCRWSQENQLKTCDQYLIRLSDYFKDSVDWAKLMGW
ncbi:hypothetical protein [Kangiella spongicola]|uniref:Uncharacterized protein n=1 Tax=Kangiella spongicola TaxID=796379 RepID=A0A318D3M2_9GAMM|nr:hypothetical protein [Kangiella spongicola]PXF62445.1 hypothetical protein DL796_11645 [Kangiella spongicola]